MSDHTVESGLFCFSLFLQTTVGIPVWEYTHSNNTDSTGIPTVVCNSLTDTHTLLLVLLLTLYKGCHRDVSNVVNGVKSKEEFSL